MRLIDHEGVVEKWRQVKLRPGYSATLEFTGAGMFRVQAESFHNQVASPGTRRTVVGLVELFFDDFRAEIPVLCAAEPEGPGRIPGLRDVAVMGPRGVRLVARLALTVALVVWATVEAVGQVPANRYEACRQQLRRAPREYESAYCFYRVTLEHRLWSDGERLFEELIAGDPGNAWLVLAYGHVHRTRDPARAEALYRRAAAAFQQAGDVAGEVETRTNLANFLRPGRPRTRGLPPAQAGTGHPACGSTVPARTRAAHRAGCGRLSHGPARRSAEDYRRLEQLALARGEGLVLANARFNLLNTSEAMASVLPTPGARDHLARMAQLSLATAMEAQHLSATLKSHRLLADLFAADAASRTRALERARQCLSMAETARQPGDEAACA